MDRAHEQEVMSESCQEEKASVSCLEADKMVECEGCKIGFKHRRNFKQHLREKHSFPLFTTKRKTAFAGLVKQVSFYPRTTMFPHDFLDSIKPEIKNELEKSLLTHRSVKWYLCSTVQVKKTDSEEHKKMYVRNHAVPLFSGSDLDEGISSQITKLMKKTTDCELKQSGWNIEGIRQVELTIVRFETAFSKMKARRSVSRL
jgi:hypothetical protein